MWGTPNTQKICALQHSSDRGVRRWFSTSKYYRTPLVCLIFLPPFTSQTPAICGHPYNILEATVLYINRDGSKSSFVIIKTMNPNRCWQNNQTVNLNGPNLKGSFTQGECCNGSRLWSIFPWCTECCFFIHVLTPHSALIIHYYY